MLLGFIQLASVASVLTTFAIIVGVLIFFSLMIVVHELGHFWAARWRGLYVDRFQIWFGKPIWKKEINGVTWGLGWIPAGGFVSLPQLAPMEAIEGQADLPPDLPPVTPLDKIIVAAAGPIASFLLAVVFAVVVWQVGKPNMSMDSTLVGFMPPDSPALAAGMKPGDRILAVDGNPVTKWRGNMEGVAEYIQLGENAKVSFLVQRVGVDKPILIESAYIIPETKWYERSALRQVKIAQATSTKVDSVTVGSPAACAGLRKGDEIVAVNGEKIFSVAAVEYAIKEGKPVTLMVKSGAEERTVELTAEIPSNWLGKEGARPILGAAWDLNSGFKMAMEHPTPYAQITQSFKWMGETLKKLFASGSEVGAEHLMGPIGIGHQFFILFSLENGWMIALWFAVVLNVNLAVLNMLPLPVVDGGHIVLNTLEIIFRRPFSTRFLEYLQGGFVLLIMGFFLFITFKDVGALFGGDKDNDLPPPEFTAKCGDGCKSH